ncbi:MAG: c-type cytochrome domain-containing protein [Planctomycetota bacterium]
MHAIPRFHAFIRCFALAMLTGPHLFAADADSAETDTVGPLDADGRVVDFNRDIAGIFRTHCLDCHGPNDAKNDFRIDDPDSVFSFVEPEDVEGSSMFVDYMLSDDPDLLMPPASHGRLSPAELSLVRVWIEEGAVWPEDAKISAEEPVADEPPPPVPDSLPSRLWAAQGFLHPATVHFPIALFLLGAVFVVLGWKWPAVGTQIPLACLWIGTASAIAASVMGWAFALEKGYGGWNRFDASMLDREVFWHRWSAVIVTLIAIGSSLAAIKGIRSESPRWSKAWKAGLLVCGLLIGLVGHQGGEMTYGEDFYPKMFRILKGEPAAKPPNGAAAKPPNGAAAQPEPGTEAESPSED